MRRTLAWVGLACSQLGRYDEAIAALDDALSGSEGPTAEHLATRGYVCGRAGRRDDARRALLALDDLREHPHVLAYARAIACVGAADHDAAFTWLDRACQARYSEMIYLRVDPRLDPLREDPRFDAILRHVGL
jgi:Flp pilus assembly protein TadD